jgi:hypothetical protein
MEIFQVAKLVGEFNSMNSRGCSNLPRNSWGLEKSKILSYNLFLLMGTMDEIRIIAITGNLVDGVAANRALVQVIQDFELLVETQLFVEQLNQLLKTACIHNPSQISGLYPIFGRDAYAPSFLSIHRLPD